MDWWPQVKSMAELCTSLPNRPRVVKVVIRGTTRHYVSLELHKLVNPSRIPPG